jgi:ABC-type uncharacterized transport system substrate-binding protein
MQNGAGVMKSWMSVWRSVCFSGGWLAALVAVAGPARAHPHVTVQHAASIVFENNALVAIDHVWTFDEFYSAMAVDGLDANKDGKYSREELADLAKTNAEGLKEFEYFTHAQSGGQTVKMAEPKTYWMEHKDGTLRLHFRLPLDKPMAADGKPFEFTVYDASYFIAFDMAEKDPMTLADGAPKTCIIKVGVPQQEADQAKKLNDSFFNQLGGASYGLGIAKTVTVTCGGK